MIQFHIAEVSPDRIYTVMRVIGCVLEPKGLFCASHVMWRYFGKLAVCLTWKENSKEV